MAASAFRHPAAGPYSNAFAVGAWVTDRGPVVGARAEKVVRHYTALLETRVKAAASGRPGPRYRTGDYRRSINRRVLNVQGVTTGTVGTNAPQGRRLEYGFVGADRLGRVYDQAPLPHFGPAADVTLAEFGRAMQKVVTG